MTEEYLQSLKEKRQILDYRILLDEDGNVTGVVISKPLQVEHVEMNFIVGNESVEVENKI